MALLSVDPDSVGREQRQGAYILQKAGGIAMDYGDFDHFDHRTKGIVACNPGLLEALKKSRK